MGESPRAKAMAHMSPAKRRKVDEPEAGDDFAKPDLRIVVENEVVDVHSLILVMVSPVFRTMLAADMSEKESKQIVLPDKSANEFRTFWDILQPLTATKVTTKNAVFLSKWASEYQIDSLKRSCEEFMLAQMPVDVPSLLHASLYGLSRRLEQCVREITEHVPAHLTDIEAALPNMSDDILQQLWPGLCSGAGLKRFDMPSSGVIRTMFPFIAAAARAPHHHILCNEIGQWPSKASFSISRASQVSGWLQDRLDDLKRRGLFK